MSRPVKILVSLISIIFVLVTLLIIFLPKIVSSDKGRGFILGAVNESITGQIKVEKINVEWFGGQLIEGVSLNDPNGKEVATLNVLSTNQPLWDILLNGWVISQSRLEELNATIVQYKDGSTNLQRALSKTVSTTTPPVASTIVAKSVNGLIHVSDDGKNISSHFEGKTYQEGLEGEFSFKMHMFNENPRSLAGVDDLTLSLDVKDFPVAFVDSFVSISRPQLNGVITALIGKSINAKITEQQTGNTASTQWAINTPNVQFKLDGNLDVNGFSLSNPAKAELKVRSELIEVLEKNKLINRSLSLQDTAQLKLVINSLTFPFQLSSKKDIGVDLEFDVSKFEIAGTTLSKNLILEKIQGKIVAPQRSEQATVYLVGKAGDRGEETFEISVDATIEKPQSLNTFFDDLMKKAKINIDAQGFPSVLFDMFTNDGISFVDLIGKHVQFAIKGETKPERGFFSVSVKSDNINLDNANFILSQGLQLQNPVKLNFILTPKAFGYLYPKQDISLREPAHFQLLVDQLTIPLVASTFSPVFDMDAKLVAMGEVQFETPRSGAFSLENSSISLKGSSLDAIQLAMHAGVVTNENSGASWEILGASTQVNLSAKFKVSPSDHLQLTEAKAYVQGSTIQLDVNGDLTNGEFALTAPATIRYVMTPSMLESLFPKLSGIKHIESDIPMVLTFATEKPSIRLGNPREVELSGHISVPLLPFKFEDQKITLRDIMIPWEFNGRDRRAKLSMSGASYLPEHGKKGTFKGKLTMKDWQDGDMFDTSSYKMRLDLINFPGETFDVVDDSHSLSTLIGHTIQSEIDIEWNGNDGNSECDLLIEGDEFLLKAALALNQAVTLKDASTPTTMDMKLTPERFAVISKILRPNPKYPLELVGDSSVMLTLEHLNIPILKKEYSIPLWNAGVKGLLHLDKMLVFDKKRNRKLPFSEVNAVIDTQNIASALSFELSTASDASELDSGNLSIEGVVRNGFKPTGELNVQGLSLDASVMAKELQTEAFCHLFCPYPTMADKVQALIGDPINSNIDVHIHKMNGPIKGTLSGTNGHASIDALLNSGYLTLNAPFVAQVEASPQLGKTIMREIAPFLSGLKESSEPITLHVDPKGFAFPVAGFDRKKISIGLCSLNMGRMVFQNSGQMQAVLGLLGSSASDTIPIWVTPLYVRMHNGKVKLERVDMLLNNRFPIAAWGGVDLIKEKVSMTLGISGYALASALNIQSVSSDYMLQIPLKGPLGNPKLDKQKAAAKISALVAQEHGTEGMVIGTVLDIASGGLTESSPPKPTTQPLPWAGQLPERQVSQSAKDSTEDSIIKSSKDKVQKGAEKIFKKIFK